MKLKTLLYIGLPLLFIGIFIFWFLAANEFIPSQEKTILKRVGISSDWEYKTLQHFYWNDWLQYTDGYEILIVRGQPDVTPTLVNWDYRQISIDEIEEKCSIGFNADAKEKLNNSALPDVFNAWSVFRQDAPDELWILLYHNSGILVIYRAHHRAIY